MSREDVRAIFVRAVLDPAFRERLQVDPRQALSGFALTDEERELLETGDHRLLALMGEIIRSSDEFAARAEADAGSRAVPEPELAASVLPLPPLDLAIRIRPYAERGPEGRLDVCYAVSVGQEEARPQGVRGTPLDPLDVRIHAAPSAISDERGSLTVRYSAAASPVLAAECTHRPAGAVTEPGAPRSRPGRAPSVWGHATDAAAVREAAARVREAEAGERGARLEELVRALRSRPGGVEDTAVAPEAEGPVGIHIVGLGLTSGAHLTAEARETIVRAQEVLYLDVTVGVREHLEQLCPRVTGLFASSYSERAHRLDAYQSVAVRVVSAALEHPPVVFAMPGHPVVGAYAPVLIRDLAAVLGLRVAVQPGISTMDCLFAELLLDPLVEGLQVHEATDLLLRGRPLQTDVPLLLFQVGSVECRLHSERRSRPERMQRLLAYLRRFYPDSHRVWALYSPPHPLIRTASHEFELRRLPHFAGDLHAGFTLYLPPVGLRPIADPGLAALVDSPAHLERLLASPTSARVRIENATDWSA